MKIFGLIGYPLGHSFSSDLFARKWATENISGCRYELMPLPEITLLHQLIITKPELVGFNVTIPYKKKIIPFLHSLSEEANAVGAVNTVQVIRKGTQIFLIGHNTDIKGIQITLGNLGRKPDKALIFGTGGAAAATSFVLDNMRIPFRMVSRTSGTNRMIYNEINQETIKQHHLLINCTPVGTSGFSKQPLPLPYDAISSDHVLFDLVYNPAITSFLKEGLTRGATCVNGYRMLIAQAEEAWKIWMEKQ